MVGFSRLPGSGLDAGLNFELSDYACTLREFQGHESREVLTYTCEYVGIDEFIRQNGWNCCSDQLRAFRHSLHYGYAYGELPSHYAAAAEQQSGDIIGANSECLRTDVGLSPNGEDVPFGKPEPLGTLLDNLRHGEGKADLAADSAEAKSYGSTETFFDAVSDLEDSDAKSLSCNSDAKSRDVVGCG